MAKRVQSLRSRSKTKHGDKGSALILVPCGFLILMVLGAIAVDSAVAYLGQRQLSDALASAAANAADAGVSHRHFYSLGAMSSINDIKMNETAAMNQACSTLNSVIGSELTDRHYWIGFLNTEVVISGTAKVGMVFGTSLPGGGLRQVAAKAAAEDQSQKPTSMPSDVLVNLQPLNC